MQIKLGNITNAQSCNTSDPIVWAQNDTIQATVYYVSNGVSISSVSTDGLTFEKTSTTEFNETSSIDVWTAVASAPGTATVDVEFSANCPKANLIVVVGV